MSLLKKKLRESFKKFRIELYDSNGNKIYYEDSDGDWCKKEYDSNNNEIYYEDSYDYWCRKEYDSNNNEIHYENSDGDWIRMEYDSNNNEIYFESRNGVIIDKRSKKEYTIKEIEEKLGIEGIKIIK